MSSSPPSSEVEPPSGHHHIVLSRNTTVVRKHFGKQTAIQLKFFSHTHAPSRNFGKFRNRWHEKILPFQLGPQSQMLNRTAFILFALSVYTSTTQHTIVNITRGEIAESCDSDRISAPKYDNSYPFTEMLRCSSFSWNSSSQDRNENLVSSTGRVEYYFWWIWLINGKQWNGKSKRRRRGIPNQARRRHFELDWFGPISNPGKLIYWLVVCTRWRPRWPKFGLMVLKYLDN